MQTAQGGGLKKETIFCFSQQERKRHPHHVLKVLKIFTLQVMTGTARTLYKDWLWSVIYQLPQETVDLAACTVNKKRVLHNGGENNYLMCSVFDWDCQALPASLNYGMYDDWMVHSVSTCVPLWSFPSFLNLLLIQFWIRRYDPGVRDTTQGCEQTIHLRHLRIINDIKVNVDDLGDTLGISQSGSMMEWCS